MFFDGKKRFGLQPFCAAVLLLFTGCSLPLGENPPPAIPPHTGFAEQTKCLSTIVPNFERYFGGSARDAEVQATWDCIGNVVSLFEKSIRGRYEDRFTSRELANFVEQNFLKNQDVSDSTMTEVFRVKQLLVGGGMSSISREEMGRLVFVIWEIRDIAVKLNPYMKIYTFNWNIQGSATLEADAKYFQSANLHLQQAAKDLASLIEKNGQSYKIDYFVSLMQEMSQYGSGNWTWLTGLEEAMPFVRKLKHALTDGDESNIDPTEWRRFALLGGRGYIQYLRYYYFIKSAPSIGAASELIFVTRSIDDLFSYLGDMVDAKANKTLTRQELLEMLQALTQFVPHFKISDAFLVEIMKIKCLFFGGNIERFDKSDFDRALAKLNEFQVLTESFLDYVHVYGLSWNPNESSPDDAKSYFKITEDNLLAFGTRLGKNMEGRYDLNDLIRLGQEYEALYPHQHEPSLRGLDQLTQKWVPSLIAIKNIVFSDEDPVVGKPGGPWSDFLMVGAQLYSRYAYYHYFLQNKEIWRGPGLQSLISLVKDSENILRALIQRKPANPLSQISFVELGRLWLSFQTAEIFPKELSSATFEGLTTVLVQKLLIDPHSRISGDLPTGLGIRGIDQLDSEFTLWSENQKFLERIYLGIPLNAGKPGSTILSDLDKESVTLGLNELKLVYDSPVALSFDQQGRMELKQPGAPYLQKTSDLINMVRSVVRLVIRSYAMDERRTDTLVGGLTSTEANIFFLDLQKSLVELGILDPLNLKFMLNRFREANLFTAVSNGDEYLDFKEGNNLGLMILSGLKIDSMLYEKLEKACQISKPSEYKYNWTLNVDCVERVYQQELPEVYSSMPVFLKFLRTLSAEQFRELFLNLLKATGYLPVPERTIKVGDLALFPQATQYVEIAFQKYDTDRDGSLNTAEAMKAFPTYRRILKEAAQGSLETDVELKALLAWLLKYGKPPTSLPERFKFKFKWIKKGEQGWDVQADREKFIKILGFMAEAVVVTP